MTQVVFRSLMAAILFLGNSTGQGLAQEGDAARGEDLYERYCATCHGLEATGQGPMVTVMTIQPADLTALAARNDGAFPLERVVRRVDGRDPLVSHGSPMPVYGDFFEGQGAMLQLDSGQRIAISQPIADLVAYLKALQQP